MNEAERAYNAPDFTLKISDVSGLGETLPIHVGAMAPEFEGKLLEGGVLRLADARNKRHVVLMMGSITSPMCVIQTPTMNELQREFGKQGVDFYLIYTKESHPGEHYLHHTTIEQKIAYARDLQRLENVQIPIVIDDLAGAIHHSYGLWPTALFVIRKEGRLVYRSSIAECEDLRRYLEWLVAWDRLDRQRPDRTPHTVYTEFIVEHDVDESEHHRVYGRAGSKAFEDFWRVNPQLRDRWPGPARR